MVYQFLEVLEISSKTPQNQYTTVTFLKQFKANIYQVGAILLFKGLEWATLSCSLGLNSFKLQLWMILKKVDDFQIQETIIEKFPYIQCRAHLSSLDLLYLDD